VLAVDLGVTNQSISGDRRLAQGMLRGSLVLIGISVGRYTSPPPRALGDKPLDDEARAALAGEVEVKHHCSVNRVHTDERKGQILDLWLARSATSSTGATTPPIWKRSSFCCVPASSEACASPCSSCR
jgi:hypothetical protein